MMGKEFTKRLTVFGKKGLIIKTWAFRNKTSMKTDNNKRN